MTSSCTHKTDLVSSLGSHPAGFNWNTLEDNTQVTQAADVPSSRWACRQWRITRTSLPGLEGTQRWGSGSTRQMRAVGEDQAADLGVFPRWVPETPGFLSLYFHCSCSSPTASSAAFNSCIWILIWILERERRKEVGASEDRPTLFQVYWSIFWD